MGPKMLVGHQWVIGCGGLSCWMRSRDFEGEGWDVKGVRQTDVTTTTIIHRMDSEMS